MAHNAMYSDLHPGSRFLADRFRNIPVTIRSQMIALARWYPNLISLGRGDPDFETPANVLEAARRAMYGGKTHYTDWSGEPELREAISRKLRRENALDVDKSEVLVTVGSQEAMFIVMLSVLNPGDEIIMPEPRYTAYDTAVEVAGGIIVPLPISPENGFQIMAGDLEKLVTPRTKAILVNSPNNPTGVVMSRENLLAIADVAKRHDLVVISDEIYEKLIFDGWKHWSIGSFPGMKERTLTVNGVSKTYNMTGWRLGYVAGPENIISAMAQLKYAITICTPSISQAAALGALTGPQDSLKGIESFYEERRAAAMARLNMLGMSYVMPRGTFYIFPEIRKYGMTSFDFCRFMLEKTQVLLFPGTAFGPGGEGFVRISLLASAGRIMEAFNRIERALDLL